MRTFRTLRADEIECRVSRCSAKGVVLLLYKTARTDADLLDEVYGPSNWQNDFKIIDGVLYGGIGIRDLHDEFIWKWDAGTESNTEAEKGRASDAFKRAGFKWGLGRELYSAPFIFIPAARCNLKESNGKYQCFDNFEVAAIHYDSSEKIDGLVITVKGARVYEWGTDLDDQRPRQMQIGDRALICADCGKTILDGKRKDGSLWPASDISGYSMARYGRSLCIDCMKVVEYGK